MCESYIGATEKSVARIRVSQAGQFIRSMFWIGCIGFGGGSALIPVIEKEIADRQGIDEILTKMWWLQVLHREHFR